MGGSTDDQYLCITEYRDRRVVEAHEWHCHGDVQTNGHLTPTVAPEPPLLPLRGEVLTIRQGLRFTATPVLPII